MKHTKHRRALKGLSVSLIVVLAFVFFLAQNAPSGIRVIEASQTDSISQFGITWTFSEPVTYGTYVNGDYWVVGPVEIVSFYPQSVDDGGRIINGSMVNPGGGTGQGGFDSYNSGSYSSSLNIAYGVSQSNPYVASTGSSIVSSVSNTQNPDRDEFLIDVAVLTVVASPPPVNSFRPPYAGSDKSLQVTYSEVDTAMLQSYATLTPVGTAPAWWETELHVERPFMDFGGSWSRRQIHGDHYSYTYGRETSQHAGTITLKLLTDAPLDDKRDTLVGFIQRGIDLWGIYNDAISNGRGTPWGPNGAHHGGRKWTILFAGALLNHSGMLNIGADAASRNDPFHEDGQTEYIDQERVDITQSSFSDRMLEDVQNYNPSAWDQFQTDYPALADIAGTGSWNTDSRDDEFHPYNAEMIGMPEWHGRAEGSVEGNAYFFHRFYRNVSAISWHGQALSALIMQLDDEWNYNAFFDYVHRHMTIARTATDPFESAIGYDPVAGLVTASTSWSRDWPNRDTGGTDIGAWVDDMWDQYWSTYYSFPY
jgi:hypothetical protein